MIAIIDYGVGNLFSLASSLRHLGLESAVTGDAAALAATDRLILPGVGAFDAAMSRITAVPGLREVLEYKALTEQVPILGVCLGMQLLTNRSEEGTLPGLGWIPAVTRRFPQQADLKVPHMGWNLALPTTSSPLTAEVGPEPRYYFVHSYYVTVNDPAHALMRTHYGLDFDSAIGRDNIYGVQFHPEKSHRFGMQILRNFAAL